MLNSPRLYELIGERIRQLREAQSPRLSQGGLAEVLGLKRTSITNIEKGNQKPTLETLYRLCEHFRVDVGDVMPLLSEVAFNKAASESRAIVVGGRSQEVGAKTANVLDRLLRPTTRTRR
jgi:DNA-binding XRE family transcriptional regulator